MQTIDLKSALFGIARAGAQAALSAGKLIELARNGDGFIARKEGGSTSLVYTDGNGVEKRVTCTDTMEAASLVAQAAEQGIPIVYV